MKGYESYEPGVGEPDMDVDLASDWEEAGEQVGNVLGEYRRKKEREKKEKQKKSGTGANYRSRAAEDLMRE